jgi:class 3 adenylate cyclase
MGTRSAFQENSGQHESRKNVTVLFIDLVDSTVLAENIDPEPLRQIIDRYFAGCAAAVEEHGGVVEKFIGDAVVAVFGAVVSHEDDAVRAIRAAASSLARLAALSAELAARGPGELAARCGICSGEVMVVIAPGQDVRVVGDAVNTASRLQNAARPGRILISAPTAALARADVALQPVPPLRLKGKAEPVPAWEVADPFTAGPAPRTRQAPLIGRDAELGELARGLRRAARDRQPSLALVLGPPGIGKSRLVREFLTGLAPAAATVLSGRCSAYGRGITYRPLAEMIRGYPGGWAEVSRLISGSPGAGTLAVRGLAAVAGPPPGQGPDRAAGTGRISPDIDPGPYGKSGSLAAAGVEEIGWAVRCMIRVLGSSRPIVLVWEDLHWAEPTLLDLIEQVAQALDDVPVLQIGVARTELLETRPAWARAGKSAVVLELPPLTAGQTATLVTELALTADVYAHQQDDVHAQVAARCEGNPLFAELMLDVLAGAAPGAATPPTIQALLGARLDQLPSGERLALDMAAVIGREFPVELLGAMAQAEGLASLEAALEPGQTAAAMLTARLAGKRLLLPAGSAGFRFAQSLLRDTAYAFTPKARRQKWHTFLARWFDRRLRATAAAAAAEEDSMTLAYHVEAASLLRRELLGSGPGLEDLAATAANVLTTAGMDALARKDLPAAVTLLERGRGLLPSGDPRHLSLALRVCDAAVGLWDEPRCLATLESARAALPDDARAGRICAIQRSIVQLRLGSSLPRTVAAEAVRTEADMAADPGDDLGWCRYHQLAAYLHLTAERMAEAETSLRQGLTRARALRDRYEEERLLCALCEVTRWTAAPVEAGLELCADLASRLAANRALLVPVLVSQAHLNALAGALGDARQALSLAYDYASDLRLELAVAAIMETSGLVESLAGAHRAAENHYRRGAAMLRAAGQLRDAQALEAAAARAVLDQGRPASAELAALAAEQEQLSPQVRIMVTALAARHASAEGRHDRAVRLAREAWPYGLTADDPCLGAFVLLDVSGVLAAAGQAGPAETAAAQALARLEAKGATLPAGQARDVLRRLAGSVGPPGRQPDDSAAPHPGGGHD